MAESYSLLYPERSPSESVETFHVHESTAEDLGINELARSISGAALTARQALGIIADPVVSPDIIRYRHDTLGDLLVDEMLLAGIEEIIPRIRELFYFNKVKRESESPLLQAIWRLGELELYVECVERLRELLARRTASIRSEGLSGLAAWLAEIANSESFRRMKSELPELRSGLKQRKSVTIGVNLDEKLRPVEATLVSINDRKFSSKTLFGRLFGPSSVRKEFESFGPMHATPMEEIDGELDHGSLPLSPLFQDVEVLMRSLIQPVLESLKSYLQVNASFLRALAIEFAFFTGAARLMQRLKARGLPICKPDIVEPDAKITRAKQFYNVQLALRDTEQAEPEIVLNDVELDDTGRIYILTGPNQGGKTTYTQGLGLLHLMAQVGLFVPAAAATVSPVDAIATHFPAGEKGQLKTGRLAEETERFAEIFHTVTATSLVLLNESLSSTSPRESLVLAEDIVKALRYLGVRCVFATHLHELAFEVDRLNRDIEGGSLITSVVAGVETDRDDTHRRTYRIEPGPPSGQSFARDIARRYGVGFEELKALIDKRGFGGEDAREE